MKTLVAAMLLASLTVTSGSAIARCEYTRDIQQTFDAEMLSGLTIHALAGYLEISAGSGDTVLFSGTACARDESVLADMDLEAKTRDNQLVLSVLIPRSELRDHGAASMDIQLTVPADLSMMVYDSSGDIRARGVSISRIEDSAGDIDVQQNRVALIVHDSAGEITVRDLKGDLEIQDSSGEIDVREVLGTVRIPRDSSGDIDVEQVSGSVLIGRDSSGNINLRDVGMNVEIDSDGSGLIKIRGVKGNVLVGSDGSGSIAATDIDGNFSVASNGSGGISTRNIKGEIKLPH